MEALLKYGAIADLIDYQENQPIDLISPSNEQGKQLLHVTDNANQEVNTIGETNNNSPDGVD
ncbi:MAG TPA: hypothetical protein LFW21_00100 [Rickettsia endosymbiont of Pyrocoelia pectoralis]|nr:hypothetical protein [Rickettsia endosymbiont of Pyrocoelia pectoralis]